MPLAPGTKVGPYEVVATLGRGGMGEVYRARDTKLPRNVALKVLPESFLADPDRVARFRREAHILASLNHAHIAAIHGLEDAGPTPALVLELVEGPTLADRIAQGPVPLVAAIAIARQIAQALDAAHEQGIVHRDLKPANIKIKEDGTVKVLDFGLAKAMSGEPTAMSPDAPTLSPAVTSPAITRAGVLLGTAGYMSPESARGRATDKRTDIWAFGCILFEMLAGKPVFDGADTTELLGAVVHLEPHWTALPASAPPGVVSVIKRCLQKDRALRARDIADVQASLDEALAAPAGPAGALPSRRSARLGWIVAGVVATVATGALIWRGGSSTDLLETRLDISAASPYSPASIAVAPDGRSVVFTAPDGDRPRLWLRPLDSEQGRPLADTDFGHQPFWSPDGLSIGFFANGQLKRLDLATGVIRVLAGAPQSRRGVWTRDGVIVFGAGSTGTLSRVMADGGAVTAATTLLTGQSGHRFPQLLPDHRRFLFMTLGLADVRGVYAASLDDPTPRRVMDRDAAFAVAPPDYHLVARQGALWARRFDPADLRPVGEYTLVAQRVLVEANYTGHGAFSASPAGTIAFRASAGTRQLVWFDRAGVRSSAVDEANDGQQELDFLAHDGRTAAVSRTFEANSDVWIVDTVRGTSRRLTTDAGVDGVAVISPDGNRVVFGMDARDDVFQVVVRRMDGMGPEELVYESSQNKNPMDWSPDGRYILVSSQSVETGWDVLALPLFGDRKPIDVARTRYADLDGRFSPNGKWVAYASVESGRSEVYVQSFPGGESKQMVSVGGGQFARWRRDGKELYYITSPGDRLMAVSVSTDTATFQAGSPRFLFAAPSRRYAYEPSPDGQKFLLNIQTSDPSPISVILNWKRPGR
jgi:serine/threonine protein kinase